MKLKPTIGLTLCLLFLFFLMPHYAYGAADPCAHTATPAPDSQSREIKIGYYPAYAMIDDMSAFGYEGYGYEFFAEISKYTGHHYTFVPCTAEDALLKLEQGEIDLLGPFEKTEEREERYAYPSHSLGNETTILCAPVDADIAYSDLEAIANKRVASLYDFYTGQLESYLEKEGIPVSYVHTNGQGLVDGMNQGEYDLILASSMFKLPGTKIVLTLNNSPVYCIARKDNQALIDEIDEALEKIYRKDFLFSAKLYQKYFTGQDYAKARLSREQELLFKEKNVFTVGFLPDMSPVQYIDKQGNPAGISIDIMNMIADEAGITLTYIPLDSVKDGSHQTVDISLGYLNEYIDKNHFYVTKPYLKATLSYIGRSHEHKARDITIGIPDYAFISRSRLINNNQAAVVKNLNSVKDRLRALKNGAVDYAVVSDISADIILKKAGYKDFEVYSSGETIPLPLMISKDLSPEYVDAFDVFISMIDENAVTASIIHNIARAVEDRSIGEILEENRIYISSFLILFSFMVIVLILYRNKALKRVMETDSLTSLYTERKFLSEGKRLLAAALPGEFMLVSIDIDNFQYINEVYGYENGTQVLKAFSNQLKYCYKNSDLIARVNADRFLTLTRVSSSNCFCGRKVCEGCLSHITSNVLGDNFKLNISRGVYVISHPGLDLNYMIDCVESARKQSKHTHGQNGESITVFTEQMEQKRSRIKQIIYSMGSALENREFKLMYQPKINLQTYKAAGAEALVRWIPAGKAPIYPDDFIPVFEENGFIEDLDYYVFEEVCAFIQRNKSRKGFPRIAVNISGVTLLKDAFTERILSLIQKYGLDAGDIEIEITESVIISNYEAVSAKLSTLREHGFQVAMDDFGSGFSSMSRLKDMPVDVLKIDKSILFDSCGDDRSMVIYEDTLLLGRGLDLITVAEGVETREQAEWLSKAGCNLAQGYYFSRPATETEFLDFLETWKKGE